MKRAMPSPSGQAREDREALHPLRGLEQRGLLDRHPGMGGEGMPMYADVMMSRQPQMAEEHKQAQRARQAIIEPAARQKHIFSPAKACERLGDAHREALRIETALVGAPGSVLIA